MIPFFRKTRKKLADDNRPLKYMRYAIGEIALVVIGILIALSINNWNEDRKKKLKERDILIHMKRNLESDLHQDYPKMVLEMSLKSTNIILDYLEQCKPYNDSLDYYFSWIPGTTRHMPNTTAYENLKTIGFDIISNDTLRENYQLLYEFNYDLIDFQKNELAYIIALEFRDFYKKHFRNYIYQKNATPNNYQSLCENNEFHEMLITVRTDKLVQKEFRIKTNAEVEKLIEMINKELN